LSDHDGQSITFNTINTYESTWETLQNNKEN
jgi:hypothetical protein